MKTKMVFCSVCAWALVAMAAAHGQTITAFPQIPSTPNSAPSSYSTAPSGMPTYVSPTEAPPPGGTPTPSDWILYRRSDSCCGPYGGDGPIKTELYLRAGWTFPIGEGVLGDVITTGWVIQGGARILFFNPELDRAWFLDLSLSNAWNQGKNPNIRFPLSILLPDAAGNDQRVNLGQGNIPGVSLRDINRTFVNIGLGRYWYLWQPANSCDRHWRVGIDAGGRYGSASAQFHQIRARSDVIGGTYIGVGTDMEIPCGCCVFQGGVRTEYSYTWSDILQQSSNVEEINLLFQMGVRY